MKNKDKEMTVLVILTPYFCRYYFVVEEDNTPLSVTVTPCDAPLEWKLTLQELPEEASGEGSGITDIRQPWKSLMTRYTENHCPLGTLKRCSDASFGVSVGFN